MAELKESTPAASQRNESRPSTQGAAAHLKMGGHDFRSAGALEPLRTLLAALPRSLPAAVFVVLHLPPTRETSIAAIVQRDTALDVRLAEGGEEIVKGRVLIAAPDHHLIVREGQVRLSRGPRENFWRPSIDVLFRTAAVAYGSLQQRSTLDRTSARREHDKGRMHGAAKYDERAAESEGHANVLRELLLSLEEAEQ